MSNKKKKLTACPFCGNVPHEYDGDYRIWHDPSCYLYIFLNHTGEDWILGSNIKKWGTRHK